MRNEPFAPRTLAEALRGPYRQASVPRSPRFPWHVFVAVFLFLACVVVLGILFAFKGPSVP